MWTVLVHVYLQFNCYKYVPNTCTLGCRLDQVAILLHVHVISAMRQICTCTCTCTCTCIN